jgi:hypothetical protein
LRPGACFFLGAPFLRLSWVRFAATSRVPFLAASWVPFSAASWAPFAATRGPLSFRALSGRLSTVCRGRLFHAVSGSSFPRCVRVVFSTLCGGRVSTPCRGRRCGGRTHGVPAGRSRRHPRSPHPPGLGHQLPTRRIRVLVQAVVGGAQRHTVLREAASHTVMRGAASHCSARSAASHWPQRDLVTLSSRDLVLPDSRVFGAPPLSLSS